MFKKNQKYRVLPNFLDNLIDWTGVEKYNLQIQLVLNQPSIHWTHWSDFVTGVSLACIVLKLKFSIAPFVMAD
ncbi:hypothetical protein NITGR_740008 [Nitrospina gracilis 3/211]|uniref:Uncharacterized protein n=1 Tax=Nitrospina gracilis (strain 3/211) TaxID=1266370 RepID=M1Z2A4_NITG3|nr:hypothetical protein NITGR_740008 [Nitrospina gracilis 3/211]